MTKYSLVLLCGVILSACDRNNRHGYELICIDEVSYLQKGDSISPHFMPDGLHVYSCSTDK